MQRSHHRQTLSTQCHKFTDIIMKMEISNNLYEAVRLDPNNTDKIIKFLELPKLCNRQPYIMIIFLTKKCNIMQFQNKSANIMLSWYNTLFLYFTMFVSWNHIKWLAIADNRTNELSHRHVILHENCFSSLLNQNTVLTLLRVRVFSHYWRLLDRIQ